MANVRTRARVMELKENQEAAQPTDALVPLIIETYKLNQAQNKAKRDYDKKRKELLGQMKKFKLARKVADMIIGEGEGAETVALEAKVETPTREVADVRKLSKLVDPDTFLNIISASKEAITTFAGLAVFEQCKVETDGTENVSVKPLKE